MPKQIRTATGIKIVADETNVNDMVVISKKNFIKTKLKNRRCKRRIIYC